MATVPLSGTNIRLLTSIPFSNDYKHTRWFDTPAEQKSYFDSKPRTHTMTEANFQRIEGYNYVSVNKSIDQLWGTNYMMFNNADYSSIWFYAFVTKLEYVNKGTTYVHFEIDVFQTWKFQMNFKPSFVVREHAKEFDSNNQPIINTIDEGLNYGTEYDTVSVKRYSPSNDYKWLVVVAKQPLHNNWVEDDKASIIGTPQPLCYYIVPFKDNGDTANVEVNNSIIEMSPPVTLLQELRKDTEAVNNIVSMYVTDYTGINHFFYPSDGTRKDYFKFSNTDDFIGAQVGETAQMIFVKVVRNFSPRTETIGSSKYEGFYTSEESKLYMYPYSLTVLDDFKGNRIEIKNEHILGTNLTLRTKGSLGSSNTVSYGVKDYNHTSSNDSQQFEVATSNESALINNNPSDIPIVNEMLAAFIQGNRNTMKNQIDVASFNGISGIVGNTIGTLAGIAGRSPAGTASGATSMVQGAGNAVLNLQGIMAKQEDIKNIPPSVSKMGTNTIYEYGNGYDGVYVVKKQIKPEFRKKLSDFFKSFGYKKNEVKIPNFHTRRYWNYVQTESCIITGNFNNDDLNDLKKVFDGGITFWHTDDVGNYALTNEVL